MAHVLIVDDDPDIRSLIVASLKTAGHTITEAADGVMGLAVARATRPDVILLDWMMPGLTGVEVCSALRAERQFDCIAVILITARVQDSDLQAASLAGVNDYIAKPFSPRELRARVEAVTILASHSSRSTASSLSASPA